MELQPLLALLAATTAAGRLLTAPSTEHAQPSALTSRFTQAERFALEKLWMKIREGNEITAPFTLWGIPIDPWKPIADSRASVVLMNFLRASGLYEVEAYTVLVETLHWKNGFGVETALAEEFPEEIFGNIGQVFGKDKSGRPIIYYRYDGNRDLRAVFGDAQRFLRWRVALMEKCVRQLDFVQVDQIVQVHDFECISLTSNLNTQRIRSQVDLIMSSYYPECSHMSFFINVPTTLTWLFWMYQQVISEQTLARVSIHGVDRVAIKDALREVIDPEHIPRRYGGSAAVFTDDANFYGDAATTAV